ncbi:hypothetical protein SEMRO_3666_G350100.1 [Seminavis robusta]|uniref:Uncharacterized protein n=1 Tax=Seminavis robusta TaxID=568900 RepID=A0A9N8F4J3_9STRA|nr:hypothetical protein SEMRO_3666_G350100.1 [Seminavis robusta]|eukprot:Sro3666_g350100.1 n/a (81) ;mRNA; r:4039-4281
MADTSTDLFSHSLPTMDSKDGNNQRSPHHDDIKESRFEAMNSMASSDHQVNTNIAKENDDGEINNEQGDTDDISVHRHTG